MNNLLNHGIVEVATLIPNEVKIANPKFNVDEMLRLLDNVIEENKLGKRQTRVVVYPELCVTGYTCHDLFNQHTLIKRAYDEMLRFAKLSNKEYSPLIFIGMPIRKDNQLFNCGVAIHKGEIIGVVPKTFIPNYSEFYEGRYFASSVNRVDDQIVIDGKTVPFTPNLLIEDTLTGAVVSAEVCEDVWVPIPPSKHHCLHGANIIVNLSASNETIGKSKYREDLIKMQSATSNCGYVYASASRGESTTDTVFSGHSLIADCGAIVGESKFLEDIEITYGEIDIENCENDRTKTTSFMTNVYKQKYERVCIETFAPVTDEFISNREISILPFVPHNIDERATEILKLQAAGLAGRLKKINCESVVIGISGGLDSTLALIVAVEAFNINGYDKKGIHAITMPCYGTTDRTLNNARRLMEILEVTSYEINIKDACEQHYKDIGYDKSKLDVTFENVQARERTQILMDVSNKIGSLVVGTGDLSELALGWCTYNGDQMSMYGVNASIPKTLVRGILESYAEHHEGLKDVLLDICDTPVSPELLPPNEDGTIKQKTEDKIGSYVVHDFILYYMLRHGFGPKKIFDLYVNAKTMHEKNIGVKEPVVDKQELLNNMDIFYNRFWTQQFKRSCMPDGVKLGSVSLSPRGDWRMASDACQGIWLDELKDLKEKYCK